MLQSHHLFLGLLAAVATLATVSLSVLGEDSITDIVAGGSDAAEPKWSLLAAPASMILWTVWGIGALSIETQSMCCRRVRSEPALATLGFGFAGVLLLVFVLEVFAAYRAAEGGGIAGDYEQPDYTE